MDLLQDTQEKEEEKENRLVVRLTTSYWHNARGVHTRKSLNTLRRKSKGFDVLDYDCQNIGADEVVERITNLYSVEDGIYEVVTCDESTDWETGYVDDYNYKLIPVEDPS